MGCGNWLMVWEMDCLVQSSAKFTLLNTNFFNEFFSFHQQHDSD